MNTDRRSVLQLLADGKINADEAERLLSALDRTEGAKPTDGFAGFAKFAGASPQPRSNGAPKYLRVTVDADVHGDSTKVNIRVPIALLQGRRAVLLQPGSQPRRAIRSERRASPRTACPSTSAS